MRTDMTMNGSMSGAASLLRSAKLCGIFGVGDLFNDCYPQLVASLGRRPDFLCDNASEKWGRDYFGIKCISPGELGTFGRDTAVVIATRRYEDVCRQLRDMGINDIFVACFDRGYDIVRSIKRLGEDPSASGEGLREIPVAGKWTLVTGASRGIGRQIALEMARRGSNIIAHSRRGSHTRDLAAACSAFGVQVESVAAELDDTGQVERLLDELGTRFPQIDIIFNNAAISLHCGPDHWGISAGDYFIHYAVNAVAPIRICSRLIPPMIRRGFGRVVNISSTIQRRPAEMPYACSKAALSKYVHDLSPCLQGTGVAISLVCPGYVRSDMGGADAPHPVESVIPGVLLGALLDADVNGRWFIAQDYAGLDLPAAISKAKFYYGTKGD